MNRPGNPGDPSTRARSSILPDDSQWNARAADLASQTWATSLSGGALPAAQAEAD